MRLVTAAHDCRCVGADYSAVYFVAFQRFLSLGGFTFLLNEAGGLETLLCIVTEQLLLGDKTKCAVANMGVIVLGILATV